MSLWGERRFLQRKQESKKEVAGKEVEEEEGEEGLSMVILLMICGFLSRSHWASRRIVKPTIFHGLSS